MHVHIESFSGSEQFLFHWEEDQSVDLLVLDVEMGQMNGVELAKNLTQIPISLYFSAKTMTVRFMRKSIWISTRSGVLSRASPHRKG